MTFFVMCDLGKRFSTRWRQLTQHNDVTRPGRGMFSRELDDVADATEDRRRNHGSGSRSRFRRILGMHGKAQCVANFMGNWIKVHDFSDVEGSSAVQTRASILRFSHPLWNASTEFSLIGAKTYNI